MVKMPKSVPDISRYKYTDCYELAIPLINSCNMACEFCFENQKHEKKPKERPERILTILDKVIPYMQEELKKHKYKQIDLKLWGGELFYDALQDEVIDAYREFVFRLKAALKLPFTIVYLSNGMFRKTERVLSLLNDTDGYISISYDPVGRFFTDGQRKLFKHNIEWFRKHQRLESVSITLTRPTIEAYVAGDEIYNSLSTDLPHIVNFYLPNKDWKKYVPSWKDYYDFCQWAIKNRRFNIDFIYNIMLHTFSEERQFVPRMCNCKEATQYCPWLGRCSQNCIDDRILDMDHAKWFYGEEIYPEVTEENHFEVRTSMARLKNGCVYCEHFDTCPMMCPASMLFTEYDASRCPIKETYESITKEDQQAFADWLEKYHVYNREGLIHDKDRLAV